MLVVSVASTPGWRAAARELTTALRRAGAVTEHAQVTRVPRVRTFMLTDLVQARGARIAALDGLARFEPRAVVYCGVTASLLWPRPGAIWLDAVAAENRPGRHGIWQRRVERHRLAASPLVMRMAERALDGLGAPVPDSVLVPVPVEPSGEAPPHRDVDAIAYAGDPVKRRLGFVLEAWQNARRPGERLIVAGTETLPRGAPADAVELAGRLEPEAYRALLRRARVFVAAPAREDFGIAPLEALADGCLLATTPAPGAYPALDIARALDPRLVDPELAPAIRTALDDPPAGYRERAAGLLAPFTRAAVDRVLADQVLPRLLG